MPTLRFFLSKLTEFWQRLLNRSKEQKVIIARKRGIDVPTYTEPISVEPVGYAEVGVERIASEEDNTEQKVTVTGTRPISIPGQILSHVVICEPTSTIPAAPILVEPEKPIAIARKPTSLWEDKGWQRTGDTYTGFFSNNRRRWYGEIKWGRNGLRDCFIFNPPQELSRHEHWCCFSHKGNGKYAVHFSTPPRNVDAAIMNVEKS